jgi:hypothetical protein
MTTEQKQIAAIIATAIFLALLTCTWFSGYHKGKKSVKCPVVEKTDTIWHTDTYYVEKPIEVVKWKDREKLVYVPVNKDSLVYVHDTTYIALEREYKLYEGENYQAQVSGIDPALDWLKINQQTAYITNTVVDKRRWTFGITAGPGVLYDGSFHGGVGVVAGVQYRF